MGWCSLILVVVVLMHHATLKLNPLDEITVNLNLNDAINGPPTHSEEWKAGKITTIDPPSQESGRQTDKKIKRILGSSKYDPHLQNKGIPDWEHWTASLKIKRWEGIPLRNTGFTFCGGVLITTQHILTALHCVIIKETLLYGTILENNDVEIFFDPENLQRWKGMKFTPIGFYYTAMNSPNRRAERLSPGNNIPRDDIVLIKLNKKVTDPLQPILRSKKDAIDTLTSGDIIIAGNVTNNFWFAGWGIYGLPQQKTKFLRYTDKLTRKNWFFGRLCPKNEDDGPVYQDTNICFLSTKDHAACQGDSGSPGVVRINKTSSAEPIWHLQSIYSRGSNCGALTNESLSIHTDIHMYETQINQWLTL